MSEYGNGVYMGLRDGIGASRTSVLFITNAGRAILQLVQFFYRLYREGLIARNDVQSLEAFMLAFDGKIDMHNVPIEIHGDYATQQEKICSALDSLGIHYYVMPDFKGGYNSPEPEIGDLVVFRDKPDRTFAVEDLAKNQAVFKDVESGERIIVEKFNGKYRRENPYHIEGKSPVRNYISVAVPQKERQLYETFLMQHIRDHLNGGEKLREDLTSFSGGRTTMIDIDERLLDSLAPIFEQLEISYSIMPDLNLMDHNKQLLIPTVQLDLVKNCYRKAMDSFNRTHAENRADDLREISAEDYRKTGETTPNTYIKEQLQYGDADQMGGLQDVPSEKGVREKAIDELGNTIHSSDTLACAKYLQDDRYLSLSIDDRTLVHNPKDTLIGYLHTKHPEMFLCRVPGTFGMNENILCIPPEQVFSVANSSEKRFVAFLEKGSEPHIISGLSGHRVTIRTAEELYQHFDTKNGSPLWSAKDLLAITREDIAGEWDELWTQRRNEIKQRLLEQAVKEKGESVVHDGVSAVAETGAAESVVMRM